MTEMNNIISSEVTTCKNMKEKRRNFEKLLDDIDKDTKERQRFEYMSQKLNQFYY